MTRRIALVLTLVLGLAAPAALADGDPASDVLPTQDVYYPYSPPPSESLSKALDALLADVRERGYPMKVALIASQADLGAYPQMFNEPQVYANLVAAGLPTNPHGQVEKGEQLHLLVIMPGGFGGKNLGDRVDEALAPVKIDAEAQTDGLVQAALQAVARIASVNGVETAVPDAATAELPDEGSGGGGRTIALTAIGVAILLLAAAFLALRRRARASDDRPPEAEPAQADGEGVRST
jgi:hypothetical protein